MARSNHPGQPGSHDSKAVKLAISSTENFMATVDSDGSIRYVYRNSICEYTGGNIQTRLTDGSIVVSNSQGQALSFESKDGMRLLYEYQGAPAKLVCVYWPDDTRLCTDRDKKWCQVNNAGTILRDIDGEPFVAPDGKLWLRGKDGIFRIFPIEIALSVPKPPPRTQLFNPVPTKVRI